MEKITSTALYCRGGQPHLLGRPHPHSHHHSYRTRRRAVLAPDRRVPAIPRLGDSCQLPASAVLGLGTSSKLTRVPQDTKSELPVSTVAQTPQGGGSF